MNETKYEIAPPPSVLRGIALYESGEYAQAVLEFDTESKDEGEKALASLFRAIALIKSGAIKEGRRILRKIIRNQSKKGLSLNKKKLAFRDT